MKKILSGLAIQGGLFACYALQPSQFWLAVNFAFWLLYGAWLVSSFARGKP